MNILKLTVSFIFLASVVVSTISYAGDNHIKPKLKLENLMSTQLESVKGTEVIVSKVTIPPNTSLPKHWQPGEEFAFVLEGSVILWQKGKKDTIGKKGDVMKVPLKQIHTASTSNEGATILVFRVHEQGKPERVKAE